MTIEELADQMNKLFDTVNKRFDSVDERFNSVDEQLAEIKEDAAITRAATNALLQWSEECSDVIGIPRVK